MFSFQNAMLLQYVTVYINYHAGSKLLGEEVAWPPLNR